MKDRVALFEACYYLLVKHGVHVPAFAFAVRTYDFFLDNMRRLTRNLYDGWIAGEFIIIMQELIKGQYRQAWHQAMLDKGLDPGTEMLPEWQEELDDLTQVEYGYVDSFYYEVLEARVNQSGVEPFLARVDLWANRWNEVYNRARVAIAAKGEKLQWIYGDVGEHCSTCLMLNGIVMWAAEWDAASVRPQNAPNAALECGGWRCKCSLPPTTQRRSPKAFETVMNITR